VSVSEEEWSAVQFDLLSRSLAGVSGKEKSSRSCLDKNLPSVCAERLDWSPASFTLCRLCSTLAASHHMFRAPPDSVGQTKPKRKNRTRIEVENIF